MKVRVAKHAGYCYGVERALKLTQDALKNLPKPVQTLGPIIHNPQVVKSLKQQGVFPVNDLSEVKSGTIVIRSHGVEPKVIEEALDRGFEVVDATCPFVKSAQQRANQLLNENYSIIIVGEHDHPEVKSILAYTGGKGVVIEDVKDLGKTKRFKRVGVVVQTTQSKELLKEIVSNLASEVSELKVFNTVCDATAKRQASAKKLAGEVDLMLVVGGKNSANTTRLTQICAQTNPKTYHIEIAEEIDPDWFSKDMVVGVTAGASTPRWILDEVFKRLKEL
ncbi:MAG: 4-hydroxy-3-methylbut-2-enyl diphosphate reductase [Candidatus Subteraquimicrobiales bacterium]|nr:4-hydroxy-3-methylbut-2-enyl diphosphate reductase [Candidatus Subteraquimicrobiales bacterium]